MKIKIEKRINPGEDAKISYEIFQESKEKIKSLLNKKRKRLFLEAKNEYDLTIKRINEDIDNEQRSELSKLTEMFQKDCIYLDYLEKMKNVKKKVADSH